jgi:hypothetical protein
VKEGQEAKRIAPLTRNRIPSASPEHSQGVLNAWTDGSFRRSAGMDGSSPKTLRAKGTRWPKIADLLDLYKPLLMRKSRRSKELDTCS